MCSYRVSLTVGHEREARARAADGAAAAGYYSGETHDWRLYVRGARGEDISSFVSKIVFTLHRSYTYPKRVIHEPPFEIRESGYGSFEVPIYIYIKHSTNPRKIKFRYKLFLQNHKPSYGSQRFSHVFDDPPELVKSCLIEGGATIVDRNPPETVTKVADMDPVSKVLSVNLSRMSEEQVKRKHFENTPVDSKRRRTESEIVKCGELKTRDREMNVKSSASKKDVINNKVNADLRDKIGDAKTRTMGSYSRNGAVRTSSKKNARASELTTEGDKVSESTAVESLKKICRCVEMSGSETDVVSELYLSLRRYEKGVTKDSLTLPSFADPIFRMPELPLSLRGILPEDDEIGGYVLR